MSSLRSLFSRLRNSVRKEQLDSELDNELRAHVELHVEDNLRAGMTPEAARRDALVKLGGVEQTKEKHRDSRGMPFLETLSQDVRFAVRLLRKSPGFTAAAILTLALGIGANVAIFTLINGLLLRPLPYPRPERVVTVDRQFKDGTAYGMSFIKFRLFERQNRSFECLAAYDILGSGLNLVTASDSELIQSRRVSSDFFRAFGVPPAIGRDFTPADNLPGAAKVAILSNRIWKTLFASDPSIAGKNVRLGGDSYTIIGVASPDFVFPGEADVWAALRVAEDPNDHSSPYHAVGRLRSGVSLPLAREDMNAALSDMRHDYPGIIQPNELGTVLTPFQEQFVGDLRPVLLLLGCTVLFVLLIACSNIASLLLARAVHRQKEIGIRSAIGGGRTRLLRQLLTEGTILSLLGGISGLLVSQWFLDIFLAMSAAGIPRNPPITVDSRVVLFTLAISILAGLVFAMAPAIQLARLNSFEVLRESGRTTSSVSTRRIQGAFVIVEISLATILLLGAGLLLTSFRSLLHLDPGFDPQAVLTFKTSMVGASFGSAPKVNAVVTRAVDRLGAIPDVVAVAASTLLPTEASLQSTIELPSHASADRPAPETHIQWRAVSRAYFDVLRMKVVEGRQFSDSDSIGSEPVALVNQAFLHQFLPNRNGVGEQILLGREMGPQFTDRPRRVVGVVADAREITLVQPAFPAVYIPLSQIPDSLIGFLNQVMPMNWLVRVSGEPLAFAPLIHKEMLSINADLVSSHPQPLNRVIAASVAQEKVQATLLGLFAASALLLGAIGLYGVLSYSVEERSREIGIRMSLGAGAGRILGLVLGDGMRLTLTGTLVGLASGFLLTNVLRSLLFGLTAANPFIFTAVPVLLTLVALIACYIPARRATRVDPMTALRYE